MTAIENILIPRTADLGGGFTVRRAIPHAERRSVGPFVFLDHMGPHRLPPGEGMDVRPHPHIALATVTWLFEGAIMHRDSLGSVQLIRPGEVNWMSAGSGIVHSERTPPDLRASGSQVHGLQFWVGLPNEAEESAPLFQHVGADDLPVIRLGDATGTLIVGSAWGATSPVKAVSRTLFTVFTLAAGGQMNLPVEEKEAALYLAEGSLDFGGAAPLEAGQLAALKPGVTLSVRALAAARFALFGGDPIGQRFLAWNFVSSSKERIERAKRDWVEGKFARVPGETEFIPLPEALMPK